MNRIKQLLKSVLIILGRIRHATIDSFQNTKSIKVFELEDKHVFCGYYDLNPLMNNLLLVHVVGLSSDASNNSAELGVFNIESGGYKKVTDTRAWCWQQGSRLRWSSEPNLLYYNDYDDHGYCCNVFDIAEQKVIKRLNFPLYDISKDEKKGVYVDFERLQKMRPGYGYSVEKRNWENMERAPYDDGLVLIDLRTNKKRLLVSLGDLAEQSGDTQSLYTHYLNHIAFSPNGKQIMFFHIWDEKYLCHDWRTELCVYDLDGNVCNVIEDKVIVSHYVWVDNNQLIITCYAEKGKEEYRLYDVRKKTYRLLDNNRLVKDGHPVMCSETEFCSDTYPDRLSYQHLFMFDMKSKESRELYKFYADYKMSGEKRCDLHPKYNKKGLIFIDSTFKMNKRSVIMIPLERTKK